MQEKPLLLEKPMAVSVREAEQIRDAFDAHKVTLTIGQTLRYNRVIRMLRRQLADIAPLASFYRQSAAGTGHALLA